MLVLVASYSTKHFKNKTIDLVYLTFVIAQNKNGNVGLCLDLTERSKKQPTVACLSNMVLALVTKKAIWLRRLIEEFRLPKNDEPTKSYCDNKGATVLSKNNVFHAQTTFNTTFLDIHQKKNIIGVHNRWV